MTRVLVVDDESQNRYLLEVPPDSPAQAKGYIFTIMAMAPTAQAGSQARQKRQRPVSRRSPSGAASSTAPFPLAASSSC